MLLGLFTGSLGPLVLLVIENFPIAIKSAISNAMGSIQAAVAAGWRGLISTASNLLGSLNRRDKPHLVQHRGGRAAGGRQHNQRAARRYVGGHIRHR